MLTFLIIVRAIVKFLRGCGVADDAMTEEELNKWLDARAAERRDAENHRNSIVDLCKLVGLPHDLTARKALAEDLGYEGALDGSAEMNIWLNKEVRARIRKGQIKLAT